MPVTVAIGVATVRINAGGAATSARVRGEVTCAAGPWRASGDWWRADVWGRDEWDVAVESRSEKGAQADQSLQVLYRIYRELRNGTWFVEGVYD